MNKRKCKQSAHWVSWGIKHKEYKLSWHYLKRAIISLFEKQDKG